MPKCIAIPSLRRNNHVVACIPYYRCQPYIRRAVDSLLAQTHRDLTVVVVNDADFDTPPWPALADIRDPRLVRFDLPQNQGLYFANAVVSGATDAPYFLVQDADDWSSPQRVESLLSALVANAGDFAISAEVQFSEDRGGHQAIHEIRYLKRVYDSSQKSDPEKFSTKLDSSYRFRIGHHGLFRTRALRSVGGYYCGLRYHYDTLLTNLLLMAGKVSHVEEPLYWRLHWPGAQTKRPETGFGSQASQDALKHGERLYKIAYEAYTHYLRGGCSAATLATTIRQITLGNIKPVDHDALMQETQRLKHQLNSLTHFIK